MLLKRNSGTSRPVSFAKSLKRFMTGIPNASSPSTPGAGSGDLFWFGDPAFQLSGRKQSIGLDHVLFAMHPLGLDGLSQGLLVGNKHERMRMPLPLCLTC